MEFEEPRRPQVVIVGGGFGGLYAARALRKARVEVTLVDRRNFHLFQPLLYQVATAVLSPANIAYPIRRVLRRQANARVLLGEAARVRLAERKLVLADGHSIPYDYLVIATGATHSYFGNDEWAAWAPGLKRIEDALEIRRRILTAYETAERETDPKTRASLLTFVIVGAGPTGVELAGAMAEISRRAFVRDFRNFDPAQARIVLIEGLERVLPTFTEKSSARAHRQLDRLGVETMIGRRVTRIDRTGVWMEGERIDASTVLWAAGVAASPLARSLGVPLDKAGRVYVSPDLTVPGQTDVFVIGDLAALVSDGRLIPGVAQAAMQEARHVANNITRALTGNPYLPFRYKDKGMLVAIGRAAAVADLRRTRLSGFIAWLAWLAVHIWFLIGFRNRLIVLLEWAWAYVTWERGARLITGEPETD